MEADSQYDWETLVERISSICITGEFKRLQRRLEDLYQRAGLAKPSLQAHHDALLSLLAEEDALDMGEHRVH